MEHFPLDFFFVPLSFPLLSCMRSCWHAEAMCSEVDRHGCCCGRNQSGGLWRRESEEKTTNNTASYSLCVSLKGWGLKWSLSMHLERRLAGLTGWDYVWLFLLWASWLMLKLLWQILNAPWRHLKETERNHRSTLWQRSISFKPGLSAFTKVFLSRLSFFPHPLVRFLSHLDLRRILIKSHLDMKCGPSAVCLFVLRGMEEWNPGVCVCAPARLFILDTVCICMCSFFFSSSPASSLGMKLWGNI